MSTDEFDIIERYFKPITGGWSSKVTLGPGDDCALLCASPGSEISVSTDTLVNGVHFPEDADPELIASRAIGANLSDLAAMGAEPLGFVLALTMPGADHHWLETFAAALSALTRKYGAPLVGGNLARGPLAITITVLGTTPAGTAIRRSGARPGDDIYVTGTLGDAARGLELLEDKNANSFLVGRYAAPEPRLAAGIALRGLASAMIDVSDGLVADLSHLLTASGAGAEISVESLPLSEALINSSGVATAVQLALYHGDDYELCFTAAPEHAAKIEALAVQLAHPITRLGGVNNSSEVVVTGADGQPLPVSGAGYRHF